MDKTGVIILAAGSSSRLGQPKQLVAFRGKSLLQHVIDEVKAFDLEPKVLVLGAYAEDVRRSVNPDRFHVVINEDWKEGIASSIRKGVASLLKLNPDLEQVLFLLSDQPLVSRQFIQDLLDSYKEQGDPITASEYNGILGVPAVFSSAMFQELLHLQGDRGASALIRKYPDKVGGVSFVRGSLDIDTLEDLHRLREIKEEY